MKHIKAAWIEQVIEFDTTDEVQEFINDLAYKACVRGQLYQVISRSDRVLHIRRQYNKNPMKEGE